MVTGAASGIGAATAALLQTRGWRVAGLDLDSSSADLSVQVDVTDTVGVEAAFALAASHLGPVSLLVTCAGHYEMVPFVEISGTDWDRMLRVHIAGLANCCRSVVPGMRTRRHGQIVAISSELGIAGGDGDAHYAAAKGAVIAVVRSLAVELVGDGIQVNSVAPGPCDTPLLVPASPWRAPSYLQTLPLGRLVTPDEVAQSVLFLVESGTFFVGEVISPNAGAVI
ncbi:MAG: SDR family NAD(P)-dependent oxidoreductase [Candidatus Dormibacteria bacterium]